MNKGARKLQLPLVITLIILIYTSSVSQEYRLPYKVGEAYAVVDQHLDQILPPEFEDVVVYNKYQLLSLQKNGLWGLYSFDGKKLLDHVIKAKGNYGAKGPKITKALSRVYSNYKMVELENNLIAVKDEFAKVQYFINTNKILDSYKPYALKVKRDDGAFINPPCLLSNILMVGNRDGSVTFIDTFGIELIDKPIRSGFPITNTMIASKKDDNYAIVKSGDDSFEYKYSRISSCTANGLYFGTITSTDNEGKRTTSYELFNDNGDFLAQTKIYPRSSTNHYEITTNGSSNIYDLMGELVGEVKGRETSFVNLGLNNYILSKRGYSYGLHDLAGKIILDTIYNVMRVEGKQLLASVKDTFYVFDSTLNLVNRFDNITSLTHDRETSYYKFGVKDGYRNKEGLIDINNNVIIKPEWRQIRTQKCEGLVILKSDSSYTVKKIGDPSFELTFKTKDRITYDCHRKIYTVQDKSIYYSYDKEGNLIDKYDTKTRTSKDQSQHKYKISKGKTPTLLNENDQQVLTEGYDDIRAFYHQEAKESIYVCRFAKNKHPSTKILNDNLEEFIPKGYSMPERWTNTLKRNLGTIIVGNDADILTNKYNFRVGLVDYKGNWLIKPFYGLFRHILSGLMIFTTEDGKTLIYDGKGNLISDQYDFVDKGNGSDFFQDRILVGTFKNKKYLKKLMKLANSTAEIAEVSKQAEALGEPDIMFGYLDKSGTMVIPQKYIRANPFSMRKSTTFVATKKGEKIVSQIIDPEGTILFEAPYDEMDYLGENHYKAKNKKVWAIVDTTGKRHTDYIFQDVYALDQIGLFYGKNKDKEYFFTDKNYAVHSLGEQYNAKVKALGASYIVAQKIIQEKGRSGFRFDFEVYDLDGLLISKFEDINDVLGTYDNRPLPPHFIAVKKDYKTKPLIFSLKHKQYLQRN